MSEVTILTQTQMSSSGKEGRQEFGYLDLLGRVKTALDTAREVAIPAWDVRPFPDQPRTYFNVDSIRRLSESIDSGGQTTSGMIREKEGTTKYELIDGERRWRAVLLIPESRRPLYKAKLINADDDVVQYLISGIANFNRENHTAIEMVETISRLVDFELPMDEIASLLGISVHWSYQMYGLKKLDPEVRKLLDPTLPKAKQLPVSAAIHISKIEAKFQLGLAERVISKDVTLGRLRGEVVKVAKREGSSIRLREVRPDKRWVSFGNKVEIVSRTVGDIEAFLKTGEIDQFVKTRADETKQLLEKLQAARKIISDMESLLLGLPK